MKNLDELLAAENRDYERFERRTNAALRARVARLEAAILRLADYVEDDLIDEDHRYHGLECPVCAARAALAEKE